MLHQFICARCGAPFSDAKHPSRAYCSRACQNRARRRPFAARFWEKVHRVNRGCWEWSAHRNRQGYGQFKSSAGVTTTAHRVAWELRSGQVIPDGLDVLHTCDNPSCVRNDDEGQYTVIGVAHPRFGHLWLGTNADNLRDMARKGRSTLGDRSPARRYPERLMRGEQCHSAKLSAHDVIGIRERLRSGETVASLARAFDVSWPSIDAIKRGRAWKHI